jgi:hypothetical protein
VLRLKNTSTESDLYKVNISFLEMLATKVASSSLFCWFPHFLKFQRIHVGVPSLMQLSISLMNSSGEIGGMMTMFSFSIFSRAFPPTCNPTLSRIALGI